MISEAKQFNMVMEELAKRHERSIIFVHFLDYYIDQQTTSTKDFHGNYTSEEEELFHEAYNEFCKLMKTLIENHGWYDFLGEYYEEYVLASTKASNKGQFYTPREISNLLSKIVGCSFSREDGLAYDPACGSARNLLEYHSKNKNVRLMGEDIDESACKMAVVNFHTHHAHNSYVHWIDSLTREYMGTSWVILPDKIITTTMEEIRMIESIQGTVSLLSLNEDVLNRIIRTLTGEHVITQEEAPKEIKEEETTIEEKENNNGLDQWLN